MIIWYATLPHPDYIAIGTVHIILNLTLLLLLLMYIGPTLGATRFCAMNGIVASFKKHFLQGSIYFARNQIVRVAMFLCHTRSPLLVVQEKPLLVVQEMYKAFNVGQAFGASIPMGIQGIHLAGNQIVRVAMFLHHVRSPLQVVQEKLKTLPLPVVQEKCKTFNAGQAFGASIPMGIQGIHLPENQIARVVMFLHHARSPLLVAQE